MIIKATLKRGWVSPRGKYYPPGTTFVFDRVDTRNKRIIYNFKIPQDSYGTVAFKDSIFKKLSEEEVILRKLREKEKNEHMKKSRDPILYLLRNSF
jgi:hypothetical protein|tara:strand:- start:6551 stop:6838 length:288 start_codon:yes stop_codon:yes gene_type:complete